MPLTEAQNAAGRTWWRWLKERPSFPEQCIKRVANTLKLVAHVYDTEAGAVGPASFAHFAFHRAGAPAVAGLRLDDPARVATRKAAAVAALLAGHAGLYRRTRSSWSKPSGPAYRNQQPRRPAMHRRRLPQRRCRQPQLKLRLPLRSRWRLRVTLPRRSAGGAAERANSAWSRVAGCRSCSSRRETRRRRSLAATATRLGLGLSLSLSIKPWRGPRTWAPPTHAAPHLSWRWH